MQREQKEEVEGFQTMNVEEEEGEVEVTLAVQLNAKHELEEGMVLQYAQDGNFELKIYLQESVGRT